MNINITIIGTKLEKIIPSNYFTPRPIILLRIPLKAKLKQKISIPNFAEYASFTNTD